MRKKLLAALGYAALGYAMLAFLFCLGIGVLRSPYGTSHLLT